MSTTLGAGVGPFFRLDGPLPIPRKFTLLQVGQQVLLDDIHWLNGVWLQSYPMDPVGVHDPCSDGSNRTKDPGGALSDGKFGGFTANMGITCNAGQIGSDPQWFIDRVVQAFKVAEAKRAEQVLANGVGASVLGAPNPHLTDANLEELDGGAAVSAKHGLESLEDAIAGTGRGGVIHATPATVTAWAAAHLVKEDNANTLRTKATGTPIVVGDGYLGAHPDGGAAPGARQAWAFATGMIRYLADPLINLPPTIIPNSYSQAIDTATNEVTWRAERNYVITFDTDTNSGAGYPPLQAGVLIDRSIATP